MSKEKEGIFIIDPDKGPPEEPVATVYTIAGKEDYIEEDSGFPCLLISAEDAKKNPCAHAMRISGAAGDRFFVKQGPHGKLFNPLGLFSEGTESRVNRHTGRFRWELREAGEKAFSFYVEFLKTKNLSYINNAERELS